MGIELWRSEEMQLVQLIIPTDAAHDTIAELGELGLLQFKDLNPEREAFARTYASQVKRCNEMTRRLRFFHEQVSGAGIPMQSASLESGVDLDELESKLEELEKDLTVINENSDRLRKAEAELVELQLVLEKAATFFDDARATAAGAGVQQNGGYASVDAPLLDDVPEALKATRLGFTAGTIDVENVNSFERLLFRATRGNMFLRHADVGTVVDPNTNKSKHKAVFVVFYAGERAKLKVTKTCEAFTANRYPFPEDPARQNQMHGDVTARLRELSSTIDAGGRRRGAVIENLARHLATWTTVVRREMAVYHTMNMLSFDVTRQALVAEAWAPRDGRLAIQQSLQRATEASNATVGTIFQPLATREQPPTYYKTTMFTQCFQGIVESYGVARYREVNPTVFTLITFPFLFAVMFGDVGHALMMCAFAGVLLWHEKALLRSNIPDTLGMMFGGRYIILLMGLFSIFTGFMYNEFFSMPMAIAGGTRYKCDIYEGAAPRDILVDRVPFQSCAGDHASSAFHEGLTRGGTPNGPTQEEPPLPYEPPYPFGIDPVWHGTRTELTFLNSVKMKMSIVIGVVHMTLGIIMSLFNHIHFRDRLSLIFEFIPQILFLWGLFGYLCFLIIFKWVAWPYLRDRSASLSVNDTSRPPDIFTIMINMILSPGSIDCSGSSTPCTENDMFPGQQFLQNFLVILAFACVPVMLLPKPLILRHRHKERTRAGYATVHGQDLEDAPLATDGEAAVAPVPAAHGHGHDGEEFNFGEVMVHQAIHTIEFVLGAVSNTASYLRLWALSLAHSQLSAVIYDKVLMYTISVNSIPILIIGSFMWLMGTLGVLMGMESLSAFLHALRLHWVEYQNKFYHGDGMLFAPFAFSDIDKDESFLHVA